MRVTNLHQNKHFFRSRFQQIFFPTLNVCVGRLRFVRVHYGHEIVTAIWNQK